MRKSLVRASGVAAILFFLTLSAASGEATVIQAAVAANSAPAPETVQAFLMFYGQLKLGIDLASLPPPESAASAEKNLDSTGGHKDAAGNYHFHATVSTADFTSGKTQDFKLTYRISGKPHTIHYSLQDDGNTYKFEITEADGAIKTESYPRNKQIAVTPVAPVAELDPTFDDFSAPLPMEMLAIVRGTEGVPGTANNLLNAFVSR